MMKLLRSSALIALLGFWPGTRVHAAPAIVQVGAGSYTTALPAGAKEPPPVIYKTENVRGPMQTSDWWSSLAWLKFSEAQYPHPLAMKFSAAGLRVYCPANIAVNKVGIFGMMPSGGDDVTLGHTATAEFPDARVDGFSDWFVTARQTTGAAQLTVSYGHGSPYVFALYDGGDARLVFSATPTVWSGDAKSAVLGLTIKGKHYGLFGPGGSTWSGLEGRELTNHLGAKNYFSLALLPDNSPQTLALFTKHAYAHVVDTKIAWRYEAGTSSVVTEFSFKTVAREGTETGTLFTLYPHQWAHSATPLLAQTYASVRGTMKLGKGSGFTTTMTFHGVLPALPEIADHARLDGYITAAAAAIKPGTGDIYWAGKQLGKLASLIPLAEQTGNKAAAEIITEELRARLENWFTATDAGGAVKDRTLFNYNTNWGTLIGYPASYGSDTELNDHHFHYGYFIRAAAEIARRDQSWAADARWGGMVKLLIRDVVSPDRDDALFPFLRCFDPYAGHSWASGHARFADGNNNESSSEAMNAWAGLILWGEATGDTKLRDLGIYLYTTELEGINAYWFDVTGQVRPPAYTPSVVTMVWGGKSVNETWFTKAPEQVHGINFLPMHAGSLYLGLHPDYVKKNFDALLAEKSSAPLKDWLDILLMYHALQDPDDALKQFNAATANTGKMPTEAGNSLANTYHWLANLAALGQVDRTITADHPLHAVFRKGTLKTYVVHNSSNQERTVNFSDRSKIKVGPHQTATLQVRQM